MIQHRQTASTIAGQLFTRLLAISVTALLACQSQSSAREDTDSGRMLARDYPGLWRHFGEQAEKQRADYVIAIDVSGSMKKFKDVVVDGLEQFLGSLPEGDYVSLVQFGTTARPIGVPSEVSAGSRQAILGYLRGVEFNDQDTDLAAMSAAILNELNRPGGNDLKFVFAFTDFLHDPDESRKGREDWQLLASRFANEQRGRDVEFYAIKLPLNTRAGRDLPLVRSVFPSLQEIVADRTMLSGWFERRKAEILRDRLRIVVQRGLAAVSPRMDTLAGADRIGLKLQAADSPLFAVLEVKAAEFPAQTTGLLTRSPLPVRLDHETDQVILARPVEGGLEKEDFEVGEIRLSGAIEFQPESELARLGLPVTKEWSAVAVPARKLSTGRFSPTTILLFWVGLGILSLIVLLAVIKFLLSLLPKPLYGQIEWRYGANTGKRELEGTKLDLATIGVTGWSPRQKHVLVNKDDEVCLVSGDNDPRPLKRNASFTIEGVTFTFKSQG